MRAWIMRLMEALARGRRFVGHDVWQIGRPGEQVPHGLIIKQVRVAILLVQGLIKDAFLLRAAALTFATILSIVPFLALIFFVIQAFDLNRGIYEMLVQRYGAGSSPVPAAASTPSIAAPDAAPAPRTGPPAEALPSDAQREGASPGPNAKDKTQQIVKKQLQEQISSLLLPLESVAGKEKMDPVRFLFESAEQGADPGSIGIVGLFFIVTTAFGLMMNIENSFNAIWGVRRTRSWYRMFSDYVVIVLLLPFLVVAAQVGNAVIQARLAGESLVPVAAVVKAIQYLLIWLAFTALYALVPNTRVRFRYALFAGVVAGTLWCVTTWAFVRFQYGLANYSRIYLTFALFPLLIMFIYFSWTIVLFGAELCFACQNEKTFAMERLAASASYAYREALALRTMVEIARRFDEGLPPLTVAECAEQWNVPTRLLNDTLDQLEQAGLILRCATQPVTYQPARSISKITVGEVVMALRNAGRDPSALREDEAFLPLLDAVAARETPLMGSTIAEAIGLLRGAAPSPSSPAPPQDPTA